MSDNTQELREKLESLILAHKLANWDKNLGQYKSEHKCQCGYTFIVDGHIADSSVPVKMAEHISVQLEALIKSQTNQAVLEARIDELTHTESDRKWFNDDGGVMWVSDRLATLRKQLTERGK